MTFMVVSCGAAARRPLRCAIGRGPSVVFARADVTAGSRTCRLTPVAGARGPKIAVPTRTIVAPSSMATSKSWLMPIDSSRSIAGSTPSADQRSRSSRRPPEVGPDLLRVVEERRQQHQAVDPRGPAARPRPPSSSRTASSGRAVLGRPRRPGPPAPASWATPRSRSPPGRARSQQVRRCRPSGCRRTARAAFRALFDCRWPTRCHRSGRSAHASIFGRASCTRFSPKSSWPAGAAARTLAAGHVFETATRRTSGASSRCARRRSDPAAHVGEAFRELVFECHGRFTDASNRPSQTTTAASGDDPPATVVCDLRDTRTAGAGTLLLELCHERLGLRRVLPVRRQLEVRLELAAASASLPRLTKHIASW